MIVDLSRSAQLFDPSVAHDGDTIAHSERFFLIVGDIDECQSDIAVHSPEFQLHLTPQVRIKRSQRLVKEQHTGLDDERPGKSHALALAA